MCDKNGSQRGKMQDVVCLHAAKMRFQISKNPDANR